jgi:hypothetical protein
MRGQGETDRERDRDRQRDRQRDRERRRKRLTSIKVGVGISVDQMIPPIFLWSATALRQRRWGGLRLGLLLLLFPLPFPSDCSCANDCDPQTIRGHRMNRRQRNAEKILHIRLTLLCRERQRESERERETDRDRVREGQRSGERESRVESSRDLFSSGFCAAVEWGGTEFIKRWGLDLRALIVVAIVFVIVTEENLFQWWDRGGGALIPLRIRWRDNATTASGGLRGVMWRDRRGHRRWSIIAEVVMILRVGGWDAMSWSGSLRIDVNRSRAISEFERAIRERHLQRALRLWLWLSTSSSSSDGREIDSFFILFISFEDRAATWGGLVCCWVMKSVSAEGEEESDRQGERERRGRDEQISSWWEFLCLWKEKTSPVVRGWSKKDQSQSTDTSQELWWEDREDDSRGTQCQSPPTRTAIRLWRGGEEIWERQRQSDRTDLRRSMLLFRRILLSNFDLSSERTFRNAFSSRDVFFVSWSPENNQSGRSEEGERDREKATFSIVSFCSLMMVRSSSLSADAYCPMMKEREEGDGDDSMSSLFPIN